MSETVLQIHDLTLSYRGTDKKVVSGIELTLQEGEIIGIIGESGCGKTSLLKAVIDPGLHNLEICSGEIRYGETELLKCSPKERKNLLGNEIGFIVQNSISSLNPIRKIRKQVRELMKEKAGMTVREAEDLAGIYMSAMNCPADIMDRYPFQLSGGQRQRTLTAMTMMLHPKVLLADEPTTALDVSVQATLLKQLRHLAKDHGTGILLITHNLGIVAGIADRIIVMYNGVAVESGDTEHILKNPRHPYTQALLHCIPDLNCDRTKPLYCIPDRGEKTEIGCVFAKRCDQCETRCRETEPPYKEEEGVQYRCFL